MQCIWSSTKLNEKQLKLYACQWFSLYKTDMATTLVDKHFNFHDLNFQQQNINEDEQA